MVGGMLALTGAIAVGPRIGRFDDSDDKTLRGHTVPVRKFLTFFINEYFLSYLIATIFFRNYMCFFLNVRHAKIVSEK